MLVSSSSSREMPVVVEEPGDEAAPEVQLVVGGHGAVNLTGQPEMPLATWFRPQDWAPAPAEFGLSNLSAPGYQAVVRSQERDRRVAFLEQDAARGDRDDLYEASLSAISELPRAPLVARRAAVQLMDESLSQASFAAPDVVFPARPR